MEKVNIEINKVLRESFSKHSTILLYSFPPAQTRLLAKNSVLSSFSGTMWSPGAAQTQVVKAQHHFPALREEGESCRSPEKWQHFPSQGSWSGFP